MKKNQPAKETAKTTTAADAGKSEYVHHTLGITDERNEVMASVMAERLSKALDEADDLDMKTAVKIAVEVAQTKEEGILLGMGIGKMFTKISPIQQLAELLNR